MASNEDIVQAIDNYVRGRNAERNRALLKRRIIDGVTIERLAEEFDLSVSQIKNIIRKTSFLLHNHLS